MTLTPENMETDDNHYDTGRFIRDISRMTPDQLEKYIRNAFTNKPDPDLPSSFFYYYFSVHSTGRGDGREAPSPAAFLAGMHDIVGSVARGTYSVGDGDLDFEFRPRFRAVISGLLDESIQVRRKPTPGESLLARFSVESVGEMKLAKDFIESGKDLKLIFPNQIYPGRLRQDLAALRAEHPTMLRKAQTIIESQKFGELKLQY